MSYDFDNGNNIVIGATYDEIRGGDELSSSFLDFHSSAFYYEGLIKTPLGNLTAGGRYVDHSYSGSKHVPRFALTKTIDNWYYKLLYSQAYRSPSILNIQQARTGTTLKAETATTYEIEVGAQVNDELSFSVNAFDVEVSDPIIWELYTDYFNEAETGSRGIEFAADYKKDIYDIGLTYSWYEENDNKVANTTVPGEDDLMLANPAHKLSLYASVNVSKDLFITPTVIYYGPRYAIVNGNKGGENIYDKLGSSILSNISVLKKNAFNIEGMDASFSVYNIFNECYDFIQHGSGWSAGGPIPGPSRTFIFTLSYDF
jgi:outer membrane cobalamin receptor